VSASADGHERVRPRQRRRARVLAFQTLYEADISAHPPLEVLHRLVEETRPDPAAHDYAEELVRGVVQWRGEIDAQIARFARAWPIDQMAAVDRNVLRLGVFEAIYNSHTIPVGVAISEAVELAKQFGSEQSSRLINGVLRRVATEPHDD